jgi:hypothetical protein
MCSERRTPSSSKIGKRCNREGWQDERMGSIGDVTLVCDVASDTEALDSVPLGPTVGEVGGGRRCNFCGVVGWEVLTGGALACGVEDLGDKPGCNDECGTCVIL